MINPYIIKSKNKVEFLNFLNDFKKVESNEQSTWDVFDISDSVAIWVSKKQSSIPRYGLLREVGADDELIYFFVDYRNISYLTLEEFLEYLPEDTKKIFFFNIDLFLTDQDSLS